MKKASLHNRIKIIRSLDIFGYPVSLSFKEKTIHKSICGGIITLFLIMIMGILTFYCFYKLFNQEYKESYKIISRLNENYGQLSLDSQNFMLAVKFDQSLLNDWSHPFLNITLTQTIQLKNNNNMIKIKNPIKLIRCESSFFSGLEEQFEKLNLEEALCPEQKTNLSIQGNFDEEVFSYLSFSVTECEDKEACREKGQIVEAFEKLSKIRFTVFMTNNNIDELNINNPLQRYIVSDIHFLIEPIQNIYRTADVYLSELLMETDYGFLPALFDRTSMIKNYTYDKEFREQTMFVLNSTTITKKSFADIYIRKSQLIVRHKRKLGNLLTILSYLGGIWSGSFLILYLILREYNKTHFFNKLANKLYSFPSQMNQVKRQMFQDNHLKTINRSSVHDFKVNKLQIFLTKIKEYLEFDRKLRLSLCELLNFLFAQIFPCLKRDDKFLLLNQAKKALMEDIDICNVLRQLHHSDKIKTLLFDNDQQRIFNFFGKPSITLNYLQTRSKQKLSENFSKKRFKKQSVYKSRKSKFLIENVDYDNIKVFLDLLQSFQKLRKNKNQNKNKNQMLIKLFKEEFSNLFDLGEEWLMDEVESDNEKEEEEEGLGKRFKILENDHRFEDIFVLKKD